MTVDIKIDRPDPVVTLEEYLEKNKLGIHLFRDGDIFSASFMSVNEDVDLVLAQDEDEEVAWFADGESPYEAVINLLKIMSGKTIFLMLDFGRCWDSPITEDEKKTAKRIGPVEFCPYICVDSGDPNVLRLEQLRDQNVDIYDLAYRISEEKLKNAEVRK